MAAHDSASTLPPGAARLESLREQREQLVAELVEADAAVARAEAERLDVIRRLRRNGELLTLPAEGSGVRFRPSSEMTLRSDRAEISVALRVTERQAETWIGLAGALSELPVTHTALGRGEISLRHASEIAAATAGLEPSVQREVDRRAVPLARTMTPRRLARRLHDLIEAEEPDAASERHERALIHRGVWVDAGRDGMAYLTAQLSAVDASAIINRLDAAATAARREGDGRTASQLRADLLADALLSEHVAGPDGERLARIRPSVHLTVPVLTLLGHSQEPAVLEGLGPIDPATARRLTAEAPTFQRLLTHPITGAVLHVDRESYRPPEELRRWLRVRDETCRFPTCGRAARRCELDHCTDWAANGSTDHDNLAHLCKGHHDLKHASGWSYRHLDERGTLEWSAPSGLAYVCEPAKTMGGAPPGMLPSNAAPAPGPTHDDLGSNSGTADGAEQECQGGAAFLGLPTSAGSEAMLLEQADAELLEYLDGASLDDADLDDWDDDWRALWWANEERKEQLRDLIRLSA